MDIIAIKAASGDHESNFKKGGTIPSEPNMLFFVYHSVIVPFLYSTNRGEEKGEGGNKCCMKRYRFGYHFDEIWIYGFNDKIPTQSNFYKCFKILIAVYTGYFDLEVMFY